MLLKRCYLLKRLKLLKRKNSSVSGHFNEEHVKESGRKDYLLKDLPVEISFKGKDGLIEGLLEDKCKFEFYREVPYTTLPPPTTPGPIVPSTTGDPHFTMFSGRKYDVSSYKKWVLTFRVLVSDIYFVLLSC